MKIEVGKVITTHGIKGEIRILSTLSENQKKEIFKLESHLFIKEKKYTIKSYRVHKGYDMVSFLECDNINQVLSLKGSKVYKEKEEITLSKEDLLDSELSTYQVLTTTGKKGLIKKIEVTGKNYKILRLEIEGKEVLLPYQTNFIKEIDQEKKTIEVILLP